MFHKYQYCNSLTEYSRFKTREVKIGGVPLGGDNPIRIQSMTNTPTMDTAATVAQVIRMVEAGCEYVRITAPTKRDAENLGAIKKELLNRGVKVPLIADIHFVPEAAEVAARLIEKVRINPGNYSGKSRLKIVDYTDAEYEEEFEKIRGNLLPLIKICKEYGTAIRIGTNHGSLSQRITGRFGDTPIGMVESALEFARICKAEGFNDLVFSMKSSNTRVMIQAYRLLVASMRQEGMDYPLHLGVTEAGDGDDARIKSAVGIGTLLADGIGDTIRVSLTEPPEAEAPVAINIAGRYKNFSDHKKIIPVSFGIKNPFEYSKRESFEVAGIGGKNVPLVVAEFCSCKKITRADFEKAGHKFVPEKNEWKKDEIAADLICIGDNSLDFPPPAEVKILVSAEHWNGEENFYPVHKFENYFTAAEKSVVANLVITKIENIADERFNLLADDKSVVFVLQTENLNGMAEQRGFFLELVKRGIKNPVIISRNYENLDRENFILQASADIGALLLEGFGDGVIARANNILTAENEEQAGLVNNSLFGILQASRVRVTKTEFISCPSCGRTLFDLVDVTAKVKEKTGHLKGLKIAVMGCIVNGPGEMADADYGYVGSARHQVTLYRGKDVVEKGVKEDIAVEKLIEIIKNDGRWVEPPK